MQLTQPVVITPRLLAGLQIGNVFISITYARKPGDEGRTRYLYYIDGEGLSFSCDDLQSGCQGGTLQEGLSSLISFLSACGEGGEYVDLFPPDIAEWCAMNTEELSIIACELEENQNAIVE
jgi:hypothetical protein